MRIGIGYDIHRLVPKRKLFLGGILIPYKKGLEGHSDADVVLHSICDSLLGAAGLGDIGEHFPDTDSQYKDISSQKLLSRVLSKVSKSGYRLVNLDIIIFVQKPRITLFKKRMRKSIAKILKVDKLRINIKAKSYENLGDIGKGDAISCQSVVLLENNLREQITENRVQKNKR